jgi:excisionase family DNA binding protein
MTQKNTFHNEKLTLDIGRQTAHMVSKCKAADLPQSGMRRMDQITKLLNENAVLPLWPEAGKVLGLKRGVTYEAARSGEIRTIRIGRLYKVPTAWLRQKLGLDGPGAAA